MSLWTCPTHGLYGGQIGCPSCGMMGDYTTVEAPPMNADKEAVEAVKAAVEECGRDARFVACRIIDLKLTLRLAQAGLALQDDGVEERMRQIFLDGTDADTNDVAFVVRAILDSLKH